MNQNKAELRVIHGGRYGLDRRENERGKRGMRPAEKQEKPDGLGHLDFKYGTEQTLDHTDLINGARVNAKPLVLPEWVDSRSSEIKEAELAAAEGRDLEKPDHLAHIKNQLERSKMEGHFVDLFTAIVRTFHDQVGMVDKEHGPGMDTWKIGNRIDLDGPMFVIAHSRKEQMLKLLENPPAKSAMDLNAKFRFRPTFDYLHENDEKGGQREIGFVVYYTYSVPGSNVTELKPITFLFGKEKEDKSTQTGNEERKGEAGEEDEHQMAA